MNTINESQNNKSFLARFFNFLTKPFVILANFTRHAILLLILFLIVSVFFFNNAVDLKKNTALIIAPNGNVVNQLSGTPSEKLINQIQGSDVPETQLRDLINAIDKASDDARISVLVLSPDYMWNIGLADLIELETAIKSFKDKSGKPVIAIAENMTQNQYYFANLADEIILDPQAFMFFQGYGSYRNYFKEGLDKLGVDVHLFRVGEYKSAAEPYIRNDMSIEAKEASLHYMNDLWDIFLQSIANKRQISIEEIKKLVDEQADLLQGTEGNMAQMYKDLGLIDQIKNQHFKNKYLAGLSAVEDNEQGFRFVGLNDYLSVIKNEKPPAQKNKVAVIVAEGAILNGEQNAGNIGGVTTSNLLREARLDKSIKAVVLRVNSGGGSVFASEQIRREVDALKVAGKPIVVSMGNVAASGGYWISMTSDKIYASEATITGSIGIYGMFMTYSNTLEKIGVHTDGVGTSAWAGAFRVDKELNEDFGKLMQANIDYGYTQFITSVAMARGLEVDMVDRIARGRVWTAKQAKELGLIDEIGGLKDALADAAQRAQLGDNYDVTWVETELTGMQKLFMSSLAHISSKLDIKLVNKNQQVLQKLLSPIEQTFKLISEAKRGQLTQYAYCFCDIKY